MNKDIYGIGKNDMKAMRKTVCYDVWMNMLVRTTTKYQNKYNTYKGVKICDDWKILSKFKQWFDINYIDGYELDKDLYLPNNKIYNSKACLFIPHYINMLIIHSNKNNKGYSIKPSGRYQSRGNVDSKSIYLGVYDTAEEAHQVYINFKAKRYMTIADTWIDEYPKIHLGLYRQAKKLLQYDWDDFVIDNPLFYYPEDKCMIW